MFRCFAARFGLLLLVIGVMSLGGVLFADDAGPMSAEDWRLRPRLLALRNNPATEGVTRAALDLVYDPTRPLLERQHAFADLGRGRTWIDGRALHMGGGHREVFGLAMSDYNLAATASSELPLLAAAWVFKGEAAVGRRLVAQLAEVVTWSPLQRSGWSLNGNTPLPPRDGNSWLATGCGVRGIADALEILGDDPLIAEVKPALVALLEKEVAMVADDWRERRPWFVGGNMTRTNQWMLPTEGLVRAALVVGPDRVRAEYELGVANLLKALDSFGSQGEFDEGISYAGMTVESALSAARAMAAAGDFRAIRHPFLKRYPLWFIHHFQPGRLMINAFDCNGVSVAARDDRDYREQLAQFAFATGSGEADWARRTLFNPGRSLNVLALLAEASPVTGNAAAPPLFAAYERAPRVNWRSSWEDNATGVWVRGGHKLDFHDHPDRGHVNFILRGRPVLIEQGTVHYGDPRYAEFAGPRGHNILQLEKRMTVKAVAPIDVRRLDAGGGRIVVDGTAGYRRLEKWLREVAWDAESLEVVDTVKVREDREDRMIFTWHTGARAPVTISGAGQEWRVSWPDAVMTLQADAAIQVTQEMRRNGTLVERKWSEELPLAASLTVRTAEKRNSLVLKTWIQKP